MNKNNQDKTKQESSSFGEVVITTALILLLLGIVVLFYFGTLRYRAEVHHNQALGALRGKEASLQKAQQLETQATNLASFEDNYHRVLSRIYLARINKVMNDDELSKTQKRSQFQQLMSATVNQAQAAITVSGHNVANWSNRGSIYQSLINYGVKDASEWATKSYKKAIELSSVSPDLHLQLARVYIAKANNLSRSKKKEAQKIKKESLASAMEHLKKAIEVKPNYWDAHYQQVVVYNQQGKSEQAIKKLKALKQVQPRSATPYFQLGSLYMRNNQLEKAEQEFKQILEQNSKFANARYFLGLVYDKQGRKQKAIEQFEKIGSFNKQNKKQVQKIIERLKQGKPALGSQEQPDQVPDLENGAATSTNATTTPQNE